MGDAQKVAASVENEARPMRVFLSPLTGRAYATDDYDEAGPLRGFVANSKHDVTDDVVRDLMAAAWARGWNECNAAPEGASPPNPYRVTSPVEHDDCLGVDCEKCHPTMPLIHGDIDPDVRVLPPGEGVPQ